MGKDKGKQKMEVNLNEIPKQQEQEYTIPTVDYTVIYQDIEKLFGLLEQGTKAENIPEEIRYIAYQFPKMFQILVDNRGNEMYLKQIKVYIDDLKRVQEKKDGLKELLIKTGQEAFDRYSNFKKK
jgi:hypothetical protein